jgi:hypothetical protein
VTFSDNARTTIDQAQAIATKYSGASIVQQRGAALKSLRNETSQHLAQLTQVDRVDYAEYMPNELAKVGGIDNDNSTGDSGAAFVFLTAGPSSEELAAGISRLLASNDPNIRQTGEGLLKKDEVKLPNGKMGRDISTYNLALHDPKVSQDRLIGAPFKMAPVESAQWFADHASLPASQGAGFESDLQEAWKLHHVPQGPTPDNETKATLAHWLSSPSWILRSLGSGLLQKRQEWQTPDLKKAMQPVQVPAGLQITPGQ